MTDTPVNRRADAKNAASDDYAAAARAYHAAIAAADATYAAEYAATYAASCIRFSREALEPKP